MNRWFRVELLERLYLIRRAALKKKETPAKRRVSSALGQA